MFRLLQFIGLFTAILVATPVCIVSTAAAQGTRNVTPPGPALLNLLRETLERNPVVRAAQSAVDAAEARVSGASRPLYNPQLEMDAEQAETRVASLGLSQTIDWADQRGARTDVANAELIVAQAEYAATHQQLGGALLAALGRYHTAQSLDQLAQQRTELMQHFLALAEKRSQTGDLSQVELNLARLAHTQATLQLSQRASDMVAAGQVLVAITGEPGSDWPLIPTNLPELKAFDTTSILTNLPELRASKARVVVARSRVTLRTRERKPNPTIGIRAGQERLFRNNDSNAYSLAGVSLSIPLYVRNNFRAEVKAAAAKLTQSEQFKQTRYRRARARLTSTADRYRLSRNAWKAWLRAGQPSLGSQVSLLERIWQTGEMSTTDYLVQINQTLDTRANALDVLGRLWTAWADWLVASGRMDGWLGQDRR